MDKDFQSGPVQVGTANSAGPTLGPIHLAAGKVQG
jgi:hypothetical protein